MDHVNDMMKSRWNAKQESDAQELLRQYEVHNRDEDHALQKVKVLLARIAKLLRDKDYPFEFLSTHEVAMGSAKYCAAEVGGPKRSPGNVIAWPLYDYYVNDSSWWHGNADNLYVTAEGQLIEASVLFSKSSGRRYFPPRECIVSSGGRDVIILQHNTISASKLLERVRVFVASLESHR